jgi:(2Fe-2S) ferredoxin
MEESRPKFQKYIFVCENERPEGACCGRAGVHLRELLKTGAKERGLAGRIRVSRSGCLDVCNEGPNVLLMPDAIWFKRVSEKDVPHILDRAAAGAD